MEMEGLHGTGYIVVILSCFPVSLQPLAVRPGDGRGRHREHQPRPAEGLLHQLQAVPDRGCAAPQSLIQSPVSGGQRPGPR